MSNILIIRFSYFKDIVLLSNLFRCIKHQYPQTDIHFLTDSRYEHVVAHHPFLNQCYFLSAGPTALRDFIRQGNYHVVIDFENSSLSRWLVKGLACTVLNGKGLFFSKDLSLQKIFKSVQPLGVKDDGKGINYFISPSEEVPMGDIPAPHQMGYLSILLDDRLTCRQQHVTWIQALCLSLAYPIMLIGSSKQQRVGEWIASADTIKIYNAAGKFSINESVDLVRRSTLVLSGEHDLRLIADAYKRPVISLDFPFNWLQAMLSFWRLKPSKQSSHINHLVRQIHHQLGKQDR